MTIQYHYDTIIAELHGELNAESERHITGDVLSDPLTVRRIMPVRKAVRLCRAVLLGSTFLISFKDRANHLYCSALNKIKTP